MMKNNLVAYEFLLIRDKLEKIVRLLVTQEVHDLMESMFLIGCLHNICHENFMKIKEDKEKNE